MAHAANNAFLSQSLFSEVGIVPNGFKVCVVPNRGPLKVTI